MSFLVTQLIWEPAAALQARTAALLGVDLPEALSLLFLLLFYVVAAALSLRVVGALRPGGTRGDKRSFRSNHGDAQVVLLGPSGSGKTATMLRLRNALHVPTVPSMEITGEARVVSGYGDIRRHIGDEQQNATSDEKEQIMLLDMPGHPRLRADALAAVAPSGGIIFFVDAADSDRIKEAAAFLYQVLLILENTDKPPCLLLAFSKGDLPQARTVEYLISSLEREVERCRTTQQAALEEEETSKTFIGMPGKIFNLRSDVTSLQAVGSISAASGDVKDVAAFLIDLMDTRK